MITQLKISINHRKGESDFDKSNGSSENLVSNFSPLRRMATVGDRNSGMKMVDGERDVFNPLEVWSEKRMLRNIYRREEESEDWQEIIEEFPNGVPRFQSKNDCEIWMRKYEHYSCSSWFTCEFLLVVADTLVEALILIIQS